MTRIRKFAVWMLITAFLFSACGGISGAAFDRTALQGGLFQLNVVHTITMESLDDKLYTAWNSAICFAAGKNDQGTTYLFTDASLKSEDRVFSELADELIAYLQAEGINANASNLSNYAVITATAYYVVHGGANIPLKAVNQSASDKILVLTTADSAYDLSAPAFDYAYADLLSAGDTVYTFTLSDEGIDGIVPATQDAYVTNWSLTTKSAAVTYAADLNDGNNALTYYDLPRSRGAQGSALFNEDGHIIGINIWSDAYEGTISLAASSITAVLGSLNVNYEVKESLISTFDLSDILLYIIILGAAVVVLIALLVFLHIRKKKLDLDDVSDLEQEALRARENLAAAQKDIVQKTLQPGRATPGHAVNIPPVASAPSVPERVTPQAAILPTEVQITVIGGKLQGTTLQVETKIVIGRDSDTCDIVFPANTTAVSRRHCAVTFNQQTGRVLLEDYSSANGTYFPSGTRIIPGRLYSLRDKDRFYVGLADNMLEVRIK